MSRPSRPTAPSRRAADAKLMGSGFSGNAYTAHGRVREPEIAALGRRDPRHPALVRPVPRRRREAAPRDPRRHRRRPRRPRPLAEIKTTNKSWRSIPRSYLRQVWWQQHVLGAERTLVAWEEHDAFVPVGDEPRCAWVDRDDAEIAKLVRLATALIDELHRRHLLGRADRSQRGTAAASRPRALAADRRPSRRHRRPSPSVSRPRAIVDTNQRLAI